MINEIYMKMFQRGKRKKLEPLRIVFNGSSYTAYDVNKKKEKRYFSMESLKKDFNIVEDDFERV